MCVCGHNYTITYIYILCIYIVCVCVFCCVCGLKSIMCCSLNQYIMCVVSFMCVRMFVCIAVLF